MATGQQVINYAKRFNGWGSSTFTRWYGVSANTAWCAIFVSYCLEHCGFKGIHASWVPNIESQALAHGTWVKMSQAQAGDIVIFTWHGGGNNTGAGSRDHVGFIIKNNGNGTFTTIEGNTSGNRVAIRNRSAAFIRKIIHPNYSGGSAAVPKTPSKPTPAPSQPSVGGTPVNEPVRYVVANEGLNVRTGPGTGYARVSTLPWGTPVKIVRRSGEWGYSNGARGWMCTSYLGSVGGARARAVSGHYTNGLYHVNTGAGLNVRSGAGTSYRRVGLLRNGTPLRIVRVIGEWGYSNGAHGWVNLMYCRRG